ncbi:MAG: FAD-binding protein [Gammaproteobacteria bacterium]|nr:FAD-binding protein [Gammaproteobacteria bacterium]NND60344.1 electron transfer flavoprotein subunit alpha/FixB family protein [Gammaproteobacteria bacterium]
MAEVLLVAEHAGGKLNPSTAKSVTCAAAIGTVTVAVFTDSDDGVASAAAQLDGVSKVLLVESAQNAQALAAVLAPQVVALASNYTHVLAPSTTFGKDLLPRVAARLGVPQVSDIMTVKSERQFGRPIYAGNVLVEVTVPDDVTVVGTVRTASFSAAATGDTAAIEKTSVDADIPDHTRYVGLESHGGERPDLQSANRVVSGGRGVGSAENFALIYNLADKLGAAAGASRAAVDAGFVPNDMQVGQTGKIIAPDLYIAIGISGAIQHITGIKDAGTIVAINKDADAPIFAVADIGLAGDLFEIVPQLEQALDS